MTAKQKKLRLLKWLRQILPGSAANESSSKRKILVEPLERRELLAGDAFMALISSSQSEETIDQFVETDTSSSSSASTSNDAQGLVAEGEPAPDLVAFAQALADSGTQFFGAAWCPACTEQKELFEDGGKFLPFIEVTNPDRSLNQVGTDENISEFPTWEFPDGSRVVGVQTLETLSQRAGVTIPQSETPSLDTLQDVSVAIGSPLHIPIDAYDPDGDPLTITVTSSDPNILQAEVLEGNRSLLLNVGGFGDLVFELFENRAPRPSGRVIELAQDGFYDDIIFHRVINNFVIQGGDPTGTGSGGSSLGDFDDQFHLDLQHNRTGALSYAKSTDDTNDSQFFITEGPQRFLDFNHSVFGQLVEGEENRDAISNTAVNTSDRPLNPVTIENATVFTDTENGIVVLRPTGNGTGTATITVTVTDSDGLATSQTFDATVVTDPINGGPFLNDISNVTTEAETPVNISLTSQDKEGDDVEYAVQRIGSTNYGLSVDSATGVVTVTPPAGFSGELQFLASVSQVTPSDTNSPTDDQVVSVTVNAPSVSAPTAIDLNAESDSGNDSDNLTNATPLVFTVSGTTSGATVEVLLNGSVVGNATATGTTTEVTVAVNTVEGTNSFSARQTIGNDSSDASPSLNVFIDRTAPDQVADGIIPSTAVVGQLFDVDLQLANEGQGLTYGLTSGPTGMTLDSATGAFAWTPTSGQVGEQSFSISLSDAAGNVTTQDFTLTVVDDPIVRFDLNIVDLSGNPLSTVDVGDTFKVQFTAQDIRGFTAAGIFSAHADLLYDPAIIEPIAGTPITYIEPFVNGQSGSTATAGLVDELGSFSNQTSGNSSAVSVMAEVTFIARAVGNTGLRLETPDETQSDITVFGLSSEVPLDRVEIGATAFAVGASFETADDLFNFDEDPGPQTLDVLANDTVGNATLTIVEVGTTSAGGQVSINSGGGTLTYEPAANFNGAETFTYTVEDTNGIQDIATVTVQITAVNDNPIATADSFTVNAGSSDNELDVLANDSSGGDTGETLLVTAVSSGSAGGTITIANAGLSLLYTPAASFQGNETFTYTLSDGVGGTETGSVTVAVGTDNPPPIVQNDSFNVQEDAAQQTFDVLANDSSADGGTLSITDVQASNRGSTFQVSSDGLSVIYQPAANVTGPEILTYTVEDSNGSSAIGIVTFTVSSENDAPVAVNDSIAITSNQTTNNLDVLANDSDADGDSLTITAVTQPSSGSVTIASDGRSLTYEPASSAFEGVVSFTYTIDDGNSATDTATVELDVRDFIPRDLTGQVSYFSVNTPSVLSGLTLRLEGTDFAGQAVQETVQVAQDGTYSFQELAPGDYNIIREPIPFLNDSGETLQVNSAEDAGDAINDMQITGGLRSQFFDIRDFLGSSFTNSLLVVVDDTGATDLTIANGAWSEFSTLDLTFDNASALSVSGVNAEANAVSGDVDLFETTSTAYEAGTTSNFRLLRVPGTPEAVGVAVQSSDDDASGEGEQTLAAAAQVEAPSDGSAAESLVGEGEATPSITSRFNRLSQQLPTPTEEADSATDAQTGIRQEAEGERTSTRRRTLSSRTTTASRELASDSVDEAMKDVLPSLEVRLSDDLQDSLTTDSESSLRIRDRLFGRFSRG